MRCSNAVIDNKSFWVRYEKLLNAAIIRDNFGGRKDFFDYYNINYSTYINARAKGNLLSIDICVRSAYAFSCSVEYILLGEEKYGHEFLLTNEQKAVMHDSQIKEIVTALINNPTIKSPTLSFVKTITNINKAQSDMAKDIG